jgi:hypothetical protein
MADRQPVGAHLVTTLTRRGIRRGAAAAGALVVAATALAFTGGHRAFADATAPPNIAPSRCPGPQYPPAGYPNPPPAGQPAIPYKVPFKGNILDGQISIPATTTRPSVLVPHIFAAVCGLVQLPQLTGVINGTDPTVAGNPAGGIHFAPNSPNVYVGGLEALRISVNFTRPLVAPIVPTPAPNGGLNISMTTSNEASQTSLGMTCSLVLNNVTFTTQSSGSLAGRPVTGPTSAGTAEVVSNNFPVPAVQTSSTCPPAVAATYNKLLGLPLAAGVAQFSAPFTFVFELDCPDTSGINLPYACPTGKP